MSFGRALIVVLLCGGCVTTVQQQCPSCPVVDGATALRLPRTAPRLFVLVPGALGYGWEWDAAVDALRRARVPFVVFWWDPWRSIARASGELHRVLEDALWAAPSLREIVVVGHSAGGLVAAHAIGGLRVPDGRAVELVTIGTPFSGMQAGPFDDNWDPLHTPTLFAVGARFRSYPETPPGVRVVEYVTSWPPDPVMQPRFGHRPAPPEAGPVGARRVAVDPQLDHNFVVARVVAELVKVEPGR
jgi:hypothetical protein